MERVGDIVTSTSLTNSKLSLSLFLFYKLRFLYMLLNVGNVKLIAICISIGKVVVFFLPSHSQCGFAPERKRQQHIFIYLFIFSFKAVLAVYYMYIYEAIGRILPLVSISHTPSVCVCLFYSLFLSFFYSPISKPL